MSGPCIVQQALTRLRNDPFHQVDDMRITSYASRYYLSPPAANCPTTFPVNSTARIEERCVVGRGRMEDRRGIRSEGHYSFLLQDS